MNDEKELLYLKKRLFDLAMQADTRRIYTHTAFLSPPEQGVFMACKKELPAIASALVGGSASAIRKLAVFGSEEDFGYAWESPIRILHLKPKAERFAEELSHRDYLGALMSLGIERELTGDIVVRGKEAWVYVLEGVTAFLCEQLTQVRHTQILCEEVQGEVPQLVPQFCVMQVNLASERMDLLLAAACGTGREQAKKWLKEDKVFLNGLPVSSAGQKLKPGDELVVRGYGKYIYDGIRSSTRKGRLNISLRKYI